MQAGNPTRVLILDYHTLSREGLRVLLERQPGIQVIGEAGASQPALALVSEARPDIILMALNLDGELNTEIIPQLIAACNHSKVIVVTGIDDPSIHQLAVQMGAMGIVQKTQPSSVLFKAIDRVHAGEVWIDRTMMASVLAQLSRPHAQDEQNGDAARIASLSEREREVVALIGKGFKNKEIADELTISETTVRHHLSSVYRKLELADRLELAIYAYRHGLATPPA